jgi:hypothetical protein
VLLPVLIAILVTLATDRARRWGLLAGLLAIEAGLIVQPSLASSNYFTIWMPPALALLYHRAASARRSSVTTQGANH